jgi:flavin-dependent amine oxidoreductase/flavin-dependent oxidoreductase
MTKLVSRRGISDRAPAVSNLVVRNVRQEADGIRSFRFEHPDGDALAAWEPGAHLEFTLPSGTVRHYSLCGDPADRSGYVVALLDQPAGRAGSHEFHDVVVTGTAVPVRGPRNHFALVDADSYLFIAGGIGITPILPMARAVAKVGKEFRIVYGGRTRTSMTFVDEVSGFGAAAGVVAEDADGRIEVMVGDPAPWMSDEDRADYERVVALFVDLAKGVDPDDPWAHPDAVVLDATPFDQWLRSVGARDAVVRMFELAKAGLAADSLRRTSLLAELRKAAVVGDGLSHYYDIDQWTRSTIAEGSATVSERMAADLGDHIRLSCAVTEIAVHPAHVEVTLATGEVVSAATVVCAIPVAPLRRIVISGLSAERLGALRRSATR